MDQVVLHAVMLSRFSTVNVYAGDRFGVFFHISIQVTNQLYFCKVTMISNWELSQFYRIVLLTLTFHYNFLLIFNILDCILALRNAL